MRPSFHQPLACNSANGTARTEQPDVDLATPSTFTYHLRFGGTLILFCNGLLTSAALPALQLAAPFCEPDEKQSCGTLEHPSEPSFDGKSITYSALSLVSGGPDHIAVFVNAPYIEKQFCLAVAAEAVLLASMHLGRLGLHASLRLGCPLQTKSHIFSNLPKQLPLPFDCASVNESVALLLSNHFVCRNRDAAAAEFAAALQAAGALPVVQQAGLQLPVLPEQPTGPEVVAAAREASVELEQLAGLLSGAGAAGDALYEGTVISC